MKTAKFLLSLLSCILLLPFESCTVEEQQEPTVEGTVTDKNGPITLELTGITATTATFKGSVNLDLYAQYDEVGIVYSLSENLEIKPLITTVVPITNIDKNNCFEKHMGDLLYNTKYYYSSYICMNGIYKYGEVQTFTTEDVKVEASAPTVTATTATFSGKVTVKKEDFESLYFGIAWSEEKNFENGVDEIEAEFQDDSTFVVTIEGLKMDKKYYYAPYISQLSSKYGEIKAFTTASASMSIAVSEITQTSVTLEGQVAEGAKDDSIEYGILYSTNENLEVCAEGCIRKALTDILDSDGKYSLKIEGLTNDTKYHYCWYARQGEEYKYGSTNELITSSVTINLTIAPITQTTATFEGSYEQHDGEGFEIGILYSESSSDLTIDSESAINIELTDNTFSHRVDGLKYNTEYYYCTYIAQDGNYKYGSILSFKTKDVKIEVSVSDKTQTTAVFKGTVEITESDAIEVGILYSSQSSLSMASSSTKQIKLSDGVFSLIVDNLTNNTRYYYKYYIKQGDGYSYGETRDFMTTSISATLGAQSVTQTTVTFSGNVNFSKTETLEFGILYSTTNKLIANTSGVKKVQVSPEVNGDFSYKATGLSHSSRYYYCYYACQDGSYTYGTVADFTTASVTINLTPSPITQTTATFSGNVELTEDGQIEVGVIYSTGNDLTVGARGATKRVFSPNSSGDISVIAEGLQYATTYNYCYYICQNNKYTYGHGQTFKTSDVSMTISADSVTQTTATFSGNVELTEDGQIEVGVIYSTGNDLTVGARGATKRVFSPNSSGDISVIAEGLQYATTYNYCYYICQNNKYTYGHGQTFKTSSISINPSVTSIAPTSVTFGGNIELTEHNMIEVGVIYSTDTDLTKNFATKQVLPIDSSGNVSFKAEGLLFATTYNYCYYACQNGKYTYSEQSTFTTLDIVAENLSSSETANCYIVTQSGTYKIKAVKGNSWDSVGDIESATVLWESFGTDATPVVGSLISNLMCSKTGYIGFDIPSDFKEGNALIAAKDSDGTILWSWHIWLTDTPNDIIYANNAGTVMDRNLGATSATPGDVGALGLLYQWGRKDPFLGSASITSMIGAASTISWPKGVDSDAETGTLEYAISNPTTFIYHNTNNYDWYYTGNSSTDNTRWSSFDSDKSIYDPCPIGYRVIEGGSDGVWSKAGFFKYRNTYDTTNYGMNFGTDYCSTSTWYPATGMRGFLGTDSLFGQKNGSYIGYTAHYWSASANDSGAYYLRFYDYDSDRTELNQGSTRSHAFPTRCQKE